MARTRRKSNKARKSNDSSNRESNSRENLNTSTEVDTNSKEGVKDTNNSHSERTGDRNEPSWYMQFPDLAFAASNFPFSDPLGSPLKFGNGTTCALPDGTVLQTADTQQAVPGLCTLIIRPTVPGTGLQTDPINVAANAFYTHLRVVNSGRKNYDPCDAMMYNLALADLYSFAMFCQKIYGVCMSYSRQNQYIGRIVCRHLGVDYADVINNLANFRYWINAFVKKLQAYAVPSVIPYYMRRAFMYAGLYSESTTGNIKDQLYQFEPESFFKFELDSTQKGSLALKTWHQTALRTVSDIITYGNDLISNVWADEDFALISGDIIKAYGSNIIGIAEIPADFAVLPVYNQYILDQFKNATIMYVSDASTYSKDGVAGYHFGNVYQNNEGQIFSYNTKNYVTAAQTNKDKFTTIFHKYYSSLLTLDDPQPKPEHVIEATRLMSKVGDEVIVDADNHDRWVVLAGTEICVAIKTARVSEIGADFQIIGSSPIYVDSATLQSSEGLILNMSFKYAPIHYIVTVTSNGEFTHLRPACSMENYTFIMKEQLAKLHEVCALSLFYVPGVATFLQS